MFNFYSNLFANTTRKLAGSLLGIGIFLIGLGLLVIFLKAIVVLVLAGLIFFAALWCISTAIGMFLSLFRSQRKAGPEVYRENVRVHNTSRDSDVI